MNSRLKDLLGRGLRLTRLELVPVRVRSGVAAGARWTLYPWTSYWRGTHERAMQAAMMGLGGGDIRSWSCWDLGAHYGLYSVGLARRVGPGGQVAAFEPNPLSFARLSRHARMNGLTWLKAFNGAVSDEAGTGELFTYGDLGSTVTHLPYDGEVRQAGSGVLEVRTYRLDDLVGAGEIRPPRFVKVDVEGHGHHALAGMKATLGAHRPILIVGFHSPQEEDGILGLLEPLRYERREIEPGTGTTGSLIGRDLMFVPV